ncbi:MAG: FHA domain-containing protein [Chloroflexi bacterium]|nr:FHA domain-containing protein [Chloroflexota bacterium]
MADTGPERPIIIAHDDKTSDHHQWTLVKDEVIVGRGEECDIVLPERQVSRQHIRIFREEDAYFVQDLDSKNGTWVNGHKLEGDPRQLYDGDDIHLALAIRVQFIGSGSTAPLPFEPPVHIDEGRLRLDRESRRAFVNQQEINPPLSPPQYRLLELLYINTGRICTRESVVEAVWPDAVGDGVSEQAIDALVRRLRDRLAELDADWQYIVTVRGHGFRLNNPSD